MKKVWTRALFVTAASAAALLFGAPALAEAPEPEADAEALLALDEAEEVGEAASALTLRNSHTGANQLWQELP